MRSRWLELLSKRSPKALKSVSLPTNAFPKRMLARIHLSSSLVLAESSSHLGSVHGRPAGFFS